MTFNCYSAQSSRTSVLSAQQSLECIDLVGGGGGKSIPSKLNACQLLVFLAKRAHCFPSSTAEICGVCLRFSNLRSDLWRSLLLPFFNFFLGKGSASFKLNQQRTGAPFFSHGRWATELCFLCGKPDKSDLWDGHHPFNLQVAWFILPKVTVFSSLDFLNLALKCSAPTAVLKSLSAKAGRHGFVRRVKRLSRHAGPTKRRCIYTDNPFPTLLVGCISIEVEVAYSNVTCK